MRSRAVRLRARMVAAIVVVPAAVGLALSPAGAVLTSDDLGCDASADITGGDGLTYHIDIGDAEATVPAEGTAAWRGSLERATSDHAGEVRLEVGPWWDIELGTWGPSANATSQTSAQGTTELPSALEDVPAGRYRVTGFHQGAEGGCAGEVVVEVERPTFSNIAGVAAPVGTALFGVLLLFSALARKRA